VKFTHSKMDYNMGWLVQAEAPPGALFRAFKEVVVSGSAKPQDISFYFVHWFVDLAGAEPYPLEGCEKFVLKFPVKVLRQFLESFSIVAQLSWGSSETEVFEEYVKWRWSSHEPDLGSVPQGKGSIAQMRLVVMAQGDSKEIIDAFGRLSPSDKDVLSEEMAVTGLKGQNYRCELRRSDAPSMGPAILIYYAPALMNKASKQKAAPVAMKVLAEVFRQTRRQWPLTKEGAEDFVIVRIDTLKEQDINSLLLPDPAHMWLIQKTSHHDGIVKQIPITSLNTVDWPTHAVLQFTVDAATRRGA